MMEWTDRHCRTIHRLLAPNAFLYTEMVTTGALLYGPAQRLLAFSDDQHPVALQLGGCEPAALAAAAQLGARAGFDEINLNLGCPSDRVQAARIGACLMAEPALVADCLQAMRESVSIPVTVKCRLGIDDRDDFDFLADLVSACADTGVATFFVHARIARLSGLSPAQNRSIPPLNYPRVYALKAAFPHLNIVLNGGLDDASTAAAHARALDGVMIGRAAYHNPWLLAELDADLFGTPLPPSRIDIVDRLIPYIEAHLTGGGRLHDVTRHLHGLFNGCRGARAFRRHLAEHSHKGDPGPEVLVAACRKVDVGAPLCLTA